MGGIELAQTDVRASNRRDPPSVAPAVAVEHRQRPEIDGVVPHVPADQIAERIEIRASVMVDHPFGITGCSRGIVERDGVPLVAGEVRGIVWITFSKKFIIQNGAESFAAWPLRVVDVDHQGITFALMERLLDDGCELGICQKNLGFAVIEDVGWPNPV